MYSPPVRRKSLTQTLRRRLEHVDPHHESPADGPHHQCPRAGCRERSWSGITCPGGRAAELPPPPPERQAPAVEANLKTFDLLDFDVFSNQKWDRLHESHARDIIVTWPDGHETVGIEKHIEDLRALFVFAPDIEITVHPIRFGSGSWTAVTGVMTGTFTRPMPTADGKTIAPTGKRFAIGMATIGHWVNGTMDHEWLFWDNQDFMRQIGLGQ